MPRSGQVPHVKEEKERVSQSYAFEHGFTPRAHALSHGGKLCKNTYFSKSAGEGQPAGLACRIYHRPWLDANVFPTLKYRKNVFTLSSLSNFEKRSLLCEAFPEASDRDEVRLCRRHTRTNQVHITFTTSLAFCQIARFSFSGSRL